MVILGGQNIKKTSWENFNFSAVQSAKLHKQVVYQSLGSPPPPNAIPKKGERDVNTAENVLYIPWMVILRGRNIKKKSFGNFDF